MEETARTAALQGVVTADGERLQYGFKRE